jgi:hypothetical protein
MVQAFYDSVPFLQSWSSHHESIDRMFDIIRSVILMVYFYHSPFLRHPSFDVYLFLLLPTLFLWVSSIDEAHEEGHGVVAAPQMAG